MRHAVLQADDKPVLRENGLDHLRHPLRVIGLDDEKDEIELLLDLRHLAEVQRRHLGVDRARRQIYRDAVLADRLDMRRPLLDESHVVSRQHEVGADRGALRARSHKGDPRIARAPSPSDPRFAATVGVRVRARRRPVATSGVRPASRRRGRSGPTPAPVAVPRGRENRPRSGPRSRRPQASWDRREF